VLTGVFTMTMVTTRFKAAKLQKVSKLQKLQPLTTLYSFMFDMFLFDVPFTTVQYIGLGYLFSLYGLQGVKLIYDSKQAKKKREVSLHAHSERRTARRTAAG